MRRSLLILLLLFSTPVFATEEIYTFQVGEWEGAAYRDTSTRAFSHCSIFALYEGDIGLAFGITAEYDFRIMLGNENWVLGDGVFYEVGLQVDRQNLGTYTAFSSEEAYLVISLGNRQDIYELLRRGQVLTVTAAQEKFYFQLIGTYKALPKVKECVDLALAFSTGNQNPFALGQSGAFVPDQENPFTQQGPTQEAETDFQDTLSLLLLLAGFEDFDFIQEPGFSIPEGGYLWSSNQPGVNVMGIFMVVEREGTIENDMGQMLATDCSGEVVTASKANISLGDYTIKQGFTSCAEESGTMYSYMTAIFTEEALAIFEHYAGQQDAPLAQSVNDGLKDALIAIISP